MPTITELPFDYKIISLSVERDAVRSPGIHLSTILKDRLITAGIERKTKGRPFTEAEQALFFEQGFLWERMVTEYVNTEAAYKGYEWDQFQTKHLEQLSIDAAHNSNGIIIRPGEVCMDGIFMTPDAINMKELCIEEWKATSIRSKNFSIPARKMEWLWQAASYARFFNLTKAIIRVWFTADMPHCVIPYHIEWSTEEIERNWAEILDHYRFMQRRKV